MARLVPRLEKTTRHIVFRIARPCLRFVLAVTFFAVAQLACNVQQDDAPYFKSPVDNYAMSDSFHQLRGFIWLLP